MTYIALKAWMHETGVKIRLPDNMLAPNTSIPSNLLQLIAIAQHYEYGSIMLDLTSSVDVAAWFASHNWEGFIVRGGADDLGVIYRFDSAKLHAAQEHFLNEAPSQLAIACADFLGIADISQSERSWGKGHRSSRGQAFLGRKTQP